MTLWRVKEGTLLITAQGKHIDWDYSRQTGQSGHPMYIRCNYVNHLLQTKGEKELQIFYQAKGDKRKFSTHPTHPLLI